MPADIAEKHHFLPQFYLSRWAVNNGKLVQFSRPNLSSLLVVPKRQTPAGTGYKPGAYSFEGVAPEKRDMLEKRMMQPLDTNASAVLDLLERGASLADWTADKRKAWFQFLASLMIRNPIDIEAIKKKYSAEFRAYNEDFEAQYVKQRREGDPATAQEYFSRYSDDTLNNFALMLMPKLLDLQRVGQKVMNMHWFVIKLEKPQLLTSDRPIIRNHLDRPDAHWIMPIGPDRLFVAVKDWKAEISFNSRRLPTFVESFNKTVVSRAIEYAYGVSDEALPFVQQHFGTDRGKSFFELIGT